PCDRGEKEVWMANVLVRQGDWVVICDGKKALVLENVGDTKFLNLKTRQVYEQPLPKTSEQGTDAPGRSINSITSRRSAMEQTDWQDQEEQRFLQKLAGHLDAEVNAGNAKALILIAPRGRWACSVRPIRPICAARCAPRSTRTWSGCRCATSRST